MSRMKSRWLSGRVLGLALGISTLLGTLDIGAQGNLQQASPQQASQQLEMMGRVVEGMYAAIVRALAKPETADQFATFMKNYRDALIAKGFTKEEALEIVKSAGLPGMPSAK